MREIKFRGHNGARWIYSEAIWFNRFPTLNDIMVCMYDALDEYQDELNIETWDNVCYLGQYTGIKDKNEKEIYEGDIVRYFEDELAVIKFKKGCFAIESENYIDYFHEILGEIEVIGNIYENKDLLD